MNGDITPISSKARHERAIEQLCKAIVEHVTDPAARKAISDAALEMADAAMARLREQTLEAFGVRS